MTCYFPNGQIAPLDVPCSTTATQSTCCGAKWACLSENICYALPQTNITAGDPIYSRGSCTDATWQSDACLQHCLDPTIDDPEGGLGLGLCGGTGATEFWCVNGAGHDCGTGRNIFTVASAPSIVKNPFATSTTSSTIVTASTSTTGSVSSISTSLTSAAAATTTSATAGQPPTSTGSSAMPTQTGTPSHAIAIGAGVGASLGVLALCAVGGLIWYRRRARRKRYSASGGSKYEQTPQNVLEQQVDGYHDVQAPEYSSMSPKKDPQPHSESYEMPSEREVYELSQVNARR
ncbi:hypothetical protein B0A48_02409 [Cryoendolithus antarcticus]|uniref:Mid2 domain-containing protein n=1 Tax=Cryoendolithus antarcticus TaxID=1507870 RepID=A0A1V8TNJ8_9PEZI|nr:hypothetical protein B0A48_02409 [Cryoendolithus antarcticus]